MDFFFKNNLFKSSKGHCQTEGNCTAGLPPRLFKRSLGNVKMQAHPLDVLQPLFPPHEVQQLVALFLRDVNSGFCHFPLVLCSC